MSVDGLRVGYLVKRGLTGPLWWAVDLAPEGGSARIERKPVASWSASAKKEPPSMAAPRAVTHARR